uniref:Uncharacterized protein n=1 Tax=Onchocerca volvulus TaxID=6282 RepID=A0A8R1XRD6_ONCVO
MIEAIERILHQLEAIGENLEYSSIEIAIESRLPPGILDKRNEVNRSQIFNKELNPKRAQESSMKEEISALYIKNNPNHLAQKALSQALMNHLTQIVLTTQPTRLDITRPAQLAITQFNPLRLIGGIWLLIGITIHESEIFTTNRMFEKVIKSSSHDLARIRHEEQLFEAEGHWKQPDIFIEEVNPDMNQVAIIRYLPHHEILTPSKSTTKLWMIYDASTHLKNETMSDTLFL